MNSSFNNILGQAERLDLILRQHYSSFTCPLQLFLLCFSLLPQQCLHFGYCLIGIKGSKDISSLSKCKIPPSDRVKVIFWFINWEQHFSLGLLSLFNYIDIWFLWFTFRFICQYLAFYIISVLYLFLTYWLWAWPLKLLSFLHLASRNWPMMLASGYIFSFSYFSSLFLVFLGILYFLNCTFRIAAVTDAALMEALFAIHSFLMGII